MLLPLHRPISFQEDDRARRKDDAESPPPSKPVQGAKLLKAQGPRAAFLKQFCAKDTFGKSLESLLRMPLRIVSKIHKNSKETEYVKLQLAIKLPKNKFIMF